MADSIDTHGNTWLPAATKKFQTDDTRIILVSYLKRATLARYPCYHGFVIGSFRVTGTEDVFNGRNSKVARKTCPKGLWTIAARKLDQLDSVELIDELKIPPGNRLEALAGDRAGQHSIRINEQYRLCFVWTDQGPAEVEIVDYHR